MKKILFFTLVLCLVAGSASATDMAKRFGLGFNTSDSPIGGRYWFSPKVGLDIGFGVFVDDDGGESTTDWTISGGLPINIIDVGERVNFNFLPWVQYANLDFGDETGSLMTILAALEFELFVTKDFSVSASHGVGFDMYSPPGDGDSETDISTFGENVTQFGVHYYLPGGGSQ